jgi:uncharacterized membrane protein YpjA
MSHKLENFNIKFFEIFGMTTCKAFEILNFITIILIMAEMVKILWCKFSSILSWFKMACERFNLVSRFFD